MATRTLGTNATTSLTAFVVGFNDLIPADLGTLTNGLRGDPPGWRGPQAEVAATGKTPHVYGASTNGQMAAGAIGLTGANQPVTNMQPYLCVNFIISPFGIYPSPT